MDSKPSAADDAVSSAPKRRTFRHLLTGGVIGALLATGIGIAATAVAMPGGGPACHMGFFGGPGMSGRMNPEEMRARMEFGTDWVLNKVDATPSQREQVKLALMSAMKDLQPLAESHRANRDAFSTALAADSIDRARLESLRVAELQLAERASQRVVKAIAEASEALTPDQRRKLLEWMHTFERRS